MPETNEGQAGAAVVQDSKTRWANYRLRSGSNRVSNATTSTEDLSRAASQMRALGKGLRECPETPGRRADSATAAARTAIVRIDPVG